jgi:hypothetical protein
VIIARSHPQQITLPQSTFLPLLLLPLLLLPMLLLPTMLLLLLRLLAVVSYLDMPLTQSSSMLNRLFALI